MTIADRRLIEDYLPLDVLNAISSKEKLHPRRYGPAPALGGRANRPVGPVGHTRRFSVSTEWRRYCRDPCAGPLE